MKVSQQIFDTIASQRRRDEKHLDYQAGLLAAAEKHIASLKEDMQATQQRIDKADEFLGSV